MWRPKTSPPGKNRESFLLQITCTGLTHRCETLSHSDQAPNLDKNTANRPQTRGSPSQNKLAHRGLPDRHSCLWAGAQSRRSLRWERLVETSTLSEGTPFGPFHSQTQHLKKQTLAEPKSSASVSINQCLHHGVRPLTLLVTPFILNSTFFFVFSFLFYFFLLFSSCFFSLFFLFFLFFPFFLCFFIFLFFLFSLFFHVSLFFLLFSWFVLGARVGGNMSKSKSGKCEWVKPTHRVTTRRTPP